jgi:hypothetical protein
MFIASAIIAWIMRDHGYKALTHVGGEKEVKILLLKPNFWTESVFLC